MANKDALAEIDELNQPFEVPLAEAKLGGATPLANRKGPHYTVQQEKPHHRVFLELAAKGYTVREIASQCGFTEVCVNNILRQPHSQQTLVNTIRENFGVDDEVVEIIKNNVKASVQLYESILNDPKKDIKDRMEAAERFMNRRYGKPNQPFSKGSSVDLNNLSDEELAAMLPTSGTGTNK